MKIVFQHPGILPVKTYGGTERILFWHMCELVKKGHHVVLIGHPQSTVNEYGIELRPLNLNATDEWESLIPDDADIVHLSYNYKELKNKKPLIVTIHGNGQPNEVFHKNAVFVSKKHAEIHGSTSFIHNALDLSEYPFEPSGKNWNRFLFLAKASWRVKNLKQTVKACRDNNKHLDVIGGRWLGFSRYVHNHGIIGGDKKLQIIRQSDALIFAVRWHEPFGIAVIEAMSQGLPVIGSPFGSLPELINEDVGFIAHSYQELNELVKSQSKKFDPIKIRKYVEENFSIEQYTEKYLNFYKKVIAHENLNAQAPMYQFKERAENLLDF